MPRRNRPDRSREVRPRPLGGSLGSRRTESSPDGEWVVRDVSGERAGKVYRCPDCDHEIPPGTPHVVAWPADGVGSVNERRHWHTGCWRRRRRRGRQ